MATLTQDVKQLVQEKAKAIRVSIVQSVTAAKSGHPGGSSIHRRCDGLVVLCRNECRSSKSKSS